MPYEIRITKQAFKDIKTMTPKLKNKLHNILTSVISENPFMGKALLGELSGNYSYRLNFRDRVVYSIDVKSKIIYLKRARTHYGK